MTLNIKLITKVKLFKKCKRKEFHFSVPKEKLLIKGPSPSSL